MPGPWIESQSTAGGAIPYGDLELVPIARWLRLNLAATGAGLAIRPVSQALQEYPEMAAHLARAHDLAAPDGGTVQMLGLLGYAARTARTPRWPLETRMRDA